MDWQLVFAWAAIAGATLYVAWRGYRALRGTKGGCSGGCGCAKTTASVAKTQPAIIVPEELRMRSRPARTSE